jgi:RND family efflux transporter MFP subunit
MKIKKLIFLILVIIIVVGGYFAFFRQSDRLFKTPSQPSTEVMAKFVNSTITADGTVTAQNQARLNFQMGGKLVYLPFKEGDSVTVGQTIAQLDTYALQRELTAALNVYRAARDSFDQTQQNSQDNVLKSQQNPVYTNANISQTDAVNAAIQRIADQNQANLDNSVANVELANYALQLSTLTSPLNGIVTQEDVTVSGVNVTPATSFVVADPNSMVFRANIPTESIYYVSVGSNVSLTIDGIKDKIMGTVAKIYPSKVVLPSGQAVYQVDIQSDDLKTMAKLDEAGRAIISTNSENVALVPAWTVLGGKYVWIDDNGTPKLIQVTAGDIHGNEIEIINGLTAGEKIITDPKYISSLKYQML